MIDQNFTNFGPESRGNLTEGTTFHKFYFEQGESSSLPFMPDSRLVIPNSLGKSAHSTIFNPVVHIMGEESAVIAYTRLIQFLDK
ncbi:Calcium/calmodulin-dependent protein kinase type II subunit gamma [Cichlidogyrus casuarinus]|uniref:Calcium/calmodulin-dependent protein kinase type II subunit gamma n=1 Tax=Cichlidogyrus casuarinus TaxID=1844966 RepID=A0ABD2PPR3_9PLAT